MSYKYYFLLGQHGGASSRRGQQNVYNSIESYSRFAFKVIETSMRFDWQAPMNQPIRAPAPLNHQSERQLQ